MKKIIAITAMVAAAAGIAFAAEVSAGVRLTTDVFHFSKGATSNTLEAFNINHENQFYQAPIAFSVSGEKAGGTLKLTDKTGGTALTGKWNIWFAPVDAVKFNVGVWTNTLNQEQIGWYRSDSGIGIDDQGNFAVTLAPIDGLSIDAVLASNFGTAWFSKVGDADPTIGQLGFMMHFGADFGTISAMFSASNNFNALKFGAGYSGSVDPLSFFVNVLGYVNSGFEKVRVEAFAATSVDALAAKLWVPVEFAPDGADLNAKLNVGAILRLDYTVGDYTLFLETGDNDFIKDGFSMGIKPGVKFNVGECAIEAAVDIAAQENFSFGIPVSFQVSF